MLAPLPHPKASHLNLKTTVGAPMTKDEIKIILDYIDSKAAFTENAKKMTEIYSGNILPFLVSRLRSDFKSDTSFNEAKSRLSPINIFPKIVNKLSKVYSNSVCLVKNDNRQEEIDLFLWNLQMDSARIKINKMLNITGCCAFEPIFKDDGTSIIRVLGGHQFLVYSNDEIDSNQVTHFIKFIDSGYAIYSKEEYLEVDFEGTVLSVLPNPYGRIPFVYVSRSLDLMPRPANDDFEMITLLPLLLSDANFALKYQAFSIIYTMNLNTDDCELAPNTIWNLQSSSQGDKPEIGHIKPSLSIDEVIKNIATQYSLWLETKNLKNSNNQATLSAQSISGVSKLIDEADIDDDLQDQRMLLTRAEEDFFELCALKSGQDWIAESYCIMQAKSKVPELESDKIDRVIKKLSNNLITKVDAIKEISGMNQEEAQIYVHLLQEESEEDKETIQ